MMLARAPLHRHGSAPPETVIAQKKDTVEFVSVCSREGDLQLQLPLLQVQSSPRDTLDLPQIHQDVGDHRESTFETDWLIDDPMRALRVSTVWVRYMSTLGTHYRQVEDRVQVSEVPQYSVHDDDSPERERGAGRRRQSKIARARSGDDEQVDEVLGEWCRAFRLVLPPRPSTKAASSFEISITLTRSGSAQPSALRWSRSSTEGRVWTITSLSSLFSSSSLPRDRDLQGEGRVTASCTRTTLLAKGLPRHLLDPADPSRPVPYSNRRGPLGCFID